MTCAVRTAQSTKRMNERTVAMVIQKISSIEYLNEIIISIYLKFTKQNMSQTIQSTQAKFDSGIG